MTLDKELLSPQKCSKGSGATPVVNDDPEN